jgi:hypothetical protein
MSWMEGLAKAAAIANTIKSQPQTTSAVTAPVPYSTHKPTSLADDIAKISAIADAVPGQGQASSTSKNPLHMISDGSRGLFTSVLGQKLGGAALKVPIFYGVSIGNALDATKVVGTLGSKLKKLRFW